MKTKFTIAAIIFILAGCGESDIDIVKSQYIDSDRITTIDNALSHRRLCSEMKWDSFKDEQGRKLVQYSCRFVDGKDFNRKSRENFVKERAEVAKASAENARMRLNEIQAELAADFPDIRARLEAIEAAQARGESGEQKKSAKLQELEGSLAVLNAYDGAYDEKRTLALYQTNVLQKHGYGEGNLQQKLEFMNRLPTEKAQKYKEREVDFSLRSIHRNIRPAKEYIQQQIQFEARQDKVAAEGRAERIKVRKTELLEMLERYRNSARESAASYEETISRETNPKKEEEIRQEAIKMFPVFNSVTEIF